MEKMKMGILGSGGIAHTMANTVKQMADVELYAVGARTLEKAQSFAEEFGMPKAYGSYEELAADPELDLVYVATPHSHHYPHVKLLLEHGKNVLCEKAFTVNADQARELFQMAEEKKLLLTEAIWTRYIPIQKTLNEVIESGAIGKVHSMTANLCYLISGVERLKKPELAGGALLDVGVYPLNFACMIDRTPVVKVTSDADDERVRRGQFQQHHPHFRRWSDRHASQFHAGYFRPEGNDLWRSGLHRGGKYQ